MSQPDLFVPPASLDEAEVRRFDLTADVQRIQAQLGDKQRVDASGRRLSAQEYWGWKKQATHALNQKLNELRELKIWLRSRRPPDTAMSHLRRLCDILKQLQREDQLNTAEKQQLLQAEIYLRNIDSPPG